MLLKDIVKLMDFRYVQLVIRDHGIELSSIVNPSKIMKSDLDDYEIEKINSGSSLKTSIAIYLKKREAGNETR